MTKDTTVQECCTTKDAIKIYRSCHHSFREVSAGDKKQTPHLHAGFNLLFSKEITSS